MSIKAIARRYATALADVVEKNGQTEQVKQELEQWKNMLEENQDMMTFFRNPIFYHHDKEKILEELIQRSKTSRITANFLRVLLQNNRFVILPEINEEFVNVLEDRQGIMSAHVVSARELSENEKEDLRKSLEKRTGKKIKLSLSVNPDIIGGIIATVGSTVYDGSVRTRLEVLKKRLIAS
ncbi:MAG: F0F1 ATP synthase subunit delta [Acidobacteria bacterium]|jgi:F-type H+-transporting ATPase subunit delta|nr:MAG: F0F1 ATP synthase subunit delta [Acidobacteriota bacterium]GIU81823.1 MAG: ATP synthase subunit delta [Pyrinomonadaceae bacterium]